MNTQNISLVRNGSIALVALVLLALALSPSVTYAADLFDGGGYSYDYSYPADSGYSYDYSYPADNSYSYDYSYPAYDSSYSYYTPSSDYYTPSYYTTPSSSYYTPSYYSTPSSNSTVYAPTNTCTASNSCNTTVDDHSIVNAPTTVTVTPNTNTDNGSRNSNRHYNNDNYRYPVCNTCSCNSNYCYRAPVVAYNTAPYVSLSAAPYTGLDLGPVGTIVYWGFLILWCLIVAYLIVVKRVQNKVLRSLNTFLFGDITLEKSADSGHADLSANKSAGVLAPSRSQLPSPAVSPSYAVDPFIFSQINRARSN